MSNGINFLTEVHPRKRRDIGASIVYRIPMFREFCMYFGCIDASRSTVDRTLAAGYSMQLYPGGEREQLLTDHNRPIVYIRKRMGFLKMAIKHQIPVVPCFAFGEDQLMHTSKFMLPFRQMIQRVFKIAIVIAFGRKGIIPLKKKLTLVLGKSISPPADESGLAEFHERYISSIQDIWVRHSQQCGYTKSLTVV